MRYFYIFSSLIILFGCGAPEPSAAKKIIAKPFYNLIPASDSTYTIQWGDSLFQNHSKLVLPKFFVEKELYETEKDSEQIVLAVETGSDSWYNIILPMKTGALETMFYCPILTDLKEKIVVTPYYGSGDTLFVIENFMTHKKQFIGMGWPECSPLLYECIDSISLHNNELYLKRNVPKGNKDTIDIRKVKLNF